MPVEYIDDSNVLEAKSNGKKAAKLSTFAKFSINARGKMSGVRKTKEEVTPTEANVQETQAAPVETTPEINNDEILKAKAEKANIVVFTTLNGNSIKASAQRRLRVNILVVDILKHAEEVLGTEMPLEMSTESFEAEEASLPEEDYSLSEPKKETFDFSSLPNMNSLEEKNNDAEIDRWLNKQTSAPKMSDDPILQEVNELKAERDNNILSLANQKKILEELRGRIEQNKALCEAKKEELRQENMALTQELNDVLAEINQLTEVANSQEAFLEDGGMSKTA